MNAVIDDADFRDRYRALESRLAASEARIVSLERERTSYGSACESAGLCMGCTPHGPADPMGCVDCLGTGWRDGCPAGYVPIEQRDREVEALESLRPVWVQGWTDDGIAAQASGAALAQLWALLAASNQTEAADKLRMLVAEVESLRAYKLNIETCADKKKRPFSDHLAQGIINSQLRVINALRDKIGSSPVRLGEMQVALDGAYAERNKVVALLARLFPAGIRRTEIEGWSDEWQNCVYIDLPTGQASWHYHSDEAHLFAALPPYDKPYDGHSTAEKYERLAALRGRDALWRADPPIPTSRVAA